MIKNITGNEAAAYGALLSRPDVICVYPITPQSEIPETLSRFQAEGLYQGKFINSESEMTSIATITGASAGGVRVFTATASQGLAWMHEGLHWATGIRLPIVIVNVNRSLGSPHNLRCTQIDSLCERDSGWMQFYCESNQEILDSVIQAYRISETISLPSMVCMDGVYLSYIKETVDIPEQSMVDEFLPPYRPTNRPAGDRYKLYGYHPPMEADFMMDRYELHKLESKCLDVVLKTDAEFRDKFGRSYPPVEEYRCDDADLAVVASGSHVGTCRQVIDLLRGEGYKVGLVKLRMFRPFPKDLVRRALLGKEKIAVIERDISLGQCGIFYQEIKWALNTGVSPSPPVYGFISGLGGADITPGLIEKAIRFAREAGPPKQETIWLGIADKETEDDYDRETLKIPYAKHERPTSTSI